MIKKTILLPALLLAPLFLIAQNSYPNLLNVPPDVTIQCSDLIPGDPGNIEVQDTCWNYNLSYLVSYPPISFPASCPVFRYVYNVWFVSDACGNLNSARQQVTILDSPPGILGVPYEDALVQEGDPLPPLPVVTAFDICEGNLSNQLFMSSDTTYGNCQNGQPSQTIRYTWTVTDACGNTVQQSWRIQIISGPVAWYTYPHLSCGEIINGITNPADNQLNQYDCAAFAYTGGEKIYPITIQDTSNLAFQLSNLQSDEDILIVNGCHPTQCLAFGDDFAFLPQAIPGTYFAIVDGRNGSNGAFTLQAICTPYCLNSGNSADRWIQSVQIGNLIKASGNNGGFADFTSLSANAPQGGSIAYTLNSNATTSGFWKVWIDFNRDRDFDDPGELVVQKNGATASGQFSIPATIPIGDLRLRVLFSIANEQSPCNHPFEGEIEDYTLHVQDPYCISQGNTYYEWINAVSLGSASNFSGNNGGYGAFTDQLLGLPLYSPTLMTLTPGFDNTDPGAPYPENWRVFIDFNRDFDFDDPGEKVLEGGPSPYPITQAITVPGGTPIGKTRMRVTLSYDISNPCNDAFDGETEDYTVNIYDPCRAPDSSSWVNQGATAVAVLWNAIPGAQKYQLRYRLQGGSAWTTGSATLNYQEISGLQNNKLYEYQIRTFCPAGWTSWSPIWNFNTTSGANPCSRPNTVADRSLSATREQIWWNAVQGALGYQLRYATLSGGWTNKIADSPSKILVGLAPDTQYKYQIRVKCTASTYSTWSTVRYFTTPILTTQLIYQPDHSASKDFTISDKKDLEINTFVVYPNPVHDELFVQGLQNEPARIQIYNAQGIAVGMAQKMQEGQSLNVRDLPAGIYVVMIKSETEEAVFCRFVKW